MDDVTRQKEHFEQIAHRYYSQRQIPAHQAFKQRMWRDFLSDKKLAPHNGRLRVLEPMCGYGEGKHILESIGGYEIEYTGFDYSESLVAYAQSRFPESRIFLQDVTRYAPDEVHDVIVLIGGLHHVFRHLDTVIRNLWSATAPGGYLISFEPTHCCGLIRRIRERVYQQNDLFDAETERGFHIDELNASFRNAGFSLVDQVYPGLLAYVLYYNPDAFPKLARGGEPILKGLLAAETPFWRSALARYFSFATLSIWRRNEEGRVDSQPRNTGRLLQ